MEKSQSTRSITGRDGVVRGATLKVASKSGLPTILQRPLQLLYPLEISSDPSTTTTEDSATQPRHSSSPVPEERVTHTRPQRKAAVEGRRVRQWCAEGDLIDHSLVVNWGEDVVD